jgi:hypothetical protein
MRRSRLCALLIDRKTPDVDEAVRFWAKALGRPVGLNRFPARLQWPSLCSLEWYHAV